MASLVDFRQDISSLETEILQLEDKYKEYLLQLEALKQESYRLAANSTDEANKAIESLIEETGGPIVTPPRVNAATPYDDIIVPPPAEHEFFDVSVLDFFKPQEIDEGHTNKKPKNISNNELNSILQKKELLSHINLENLYRLNGVTAFAVNDPSIDEDTEAKNLRQLGIRFDLFNCKTQKFRKPHYLILKKNDKNDQWEIFKKTIPEYVELDLKWLNLDLYKFTSKVRSQMIKANEVDFLSGNILAG